MKKPYSKPMVTFEDYALDLPIAAGCTPEYIDEAYNLKELGYVSMGYFNSLESQCSKPYVGWDDDKLCYYTATAQIFTS